MQQGSRRSTALLSVKRSSSLEYPLRMMPQISWTPIGGVTKPIARFTTIITPKWIDSYPIVVTIGNKIGVKIRIAWSYP